MIHDLASIREKLLDKYNHFDGKTPHGGDIDYKDGILTGLAMALRTVDQLMESEDEAMAREYGEKV